METEDAKGSIIPKVGEREGTELDGGGRRPRVLLAHSGSRCGHLAQKMPRGTQSIEIGHWRSLKAGTGAEIGITFRNRHLTFGEIFGAASAVAGCRTSLSLRDRLFRGSKKKRVERESVGKIEDAVVFCSMAPALKGQESADPCAMMIADVRG